MTNGRGAGMASFMTKKKKYKFQVEICLEELLEVPFVNAVLFAKLRLLDGGNFQDHSSREEVRDHKVKWGAKFSFPCKMSANASTGVLERCVLRISVRKESKGGRSFMKLGLVDLNLAEYAGAGLTYKKALLEGYDTRHRQDNSMLQFSIVMNMLSGDVLFKVPSPSLKHKSVASENQEMEPRSEEFSGESVGGSTASGSSGFGSLPKKRPALLSSDLVIGHTLTENNVPSCVTDSTLSDQITPLILTTVTQTTQQPQPEPVTHEEVLCSAETGHSRNSSNTSQLSKASGYSSINSHSRQSSSGDSGHVRGQYKNRTASNTTNHPSSTLDPQLRDVKSNFVRVNTYPNRIVRIPNTIIHEDTFNTSTPKHNSNTTPLTPPPLNDDDDVSRYYTPPETTSRLGSFQKQKSVVSSSSAEEYGTPVGTINVKADMFTQKFNELQKSSSTTVVDNNNSKESILIDDVSVSRGVVRSKSEFKIPATHQAVVSRKNIFNSDNLYAILTPILKRKRANPLLDGDRRSDGSAPVVKAQHRSDARTTSLNSIPLSSGSGSAGGTGDSNYLGVQPILQRGVTHRKLLMDGTAGGSGGGGKLSSLAVSPPDETPATVSSDCSQNNTIRRPSVTTNPSSSSLVLSETGSLDRAKAAYERRKKTQIGQDSDTVTVSGRVENTRVNTDHLIEELLKDTNLEQADDSAETSGLQLFIAKDGTAALGNHEVKSQMSTGVQVFKQVVMDDNR